MRRLLCRLLFRGTSHSEGNEGGTEPDEPPVPSTKLDSPSATSHTAPPESPHGRRAAPSRPHAAMADPLTARAIPTGVIPKTDGGISAPSKGRKKVEEPEPRPPRRIPGRRDGPTQTRTATKNGSGGNRVGRPTSKPRPELICRRPSGSVQWEVLLSADEESRIALVKQNGEPLSLGDGGVVSHVVRRSPVHRLRARPIDPRLAVRQEPTDLQAEQSLDRGWPKHHPPDEGPLHRDRAGGVGPFGPCAR